MNQRAQEPMPPAPDGSDAEPASDVATSDEPDSTQEESTPEQPVVQHSGTPLVEPASNHPPAGT